MTVDLEARLWRRVAAGPDGCWIWTGSVSTPGYGQIKVAGKNRTTHRISYEMARGEIPQGLQLDHLCRVRRCLNPDHLEVVTQQENVLRGMNPCAVNARKDACHQGHPFDERNTFRTHRGHRGCRQCRRVK